MFERARRFGRGDAPRRESEGGVAVDERPSRADEPPADRAPREGVADQAPTAQRTRLPEDAIVLDREARIRQRERFGGFNWGAAFFGWLVATGMATILIAILAAAGAAIGLTHSNVNADTVAKSADTVSIIGGIVLIAILMLAYYAGGYVAGRMSRFDGARQGFGVWLFGLVVTALLAAAGAIFGSQYNVLSQLHLPRIPIDEGALTTGGGITLAAIVLGTLLTAIAGAKIGQLYHRRVDREATAI
ncbi:MAG: hypothetical protein NVSMB25_16010 [Thermoleophilaceae bacterium]